ncbi:uncharacterized protein LOC128963842 [Oppia nitens]|uniref:uncharacterized protein LOC128963842 n=1 Tax=Oppia nitens TaxID=1686743 RepID=UPI0023D9F993|nr:uncharacterized protein LOC128963842 [Oppia nitens]
MPGHDISRFVDITPFLAKHFKCCICLNIFNKAVTNHCGHTYCRSCIRQWIYTPSDDCPECRHPLATRKRSHQLADDDRLAVVINGYVLENNLKVNAMVAEMVVKCEYSGNGCDQAMPMDLIGGHERHCGYRFCPTCGHIIGDSDSSSSSVSAAGSYGQQQQHNCVDVLIDENHNYRDRIKELEDKYCEMDGQCQEYKRRMCLFQELLKLAKAQQKRLKDRNARLETEIQMKIETEFQLRQSLDNTINGLSAAVSTDIGTDDDDEEELDDDGDDTVEEVDDEDNDDVEQELNNTVVVNIIGEQIQANADAAIDLSDGNTTEVEVEQFSNDDDDNNEDDVDEEATVHLMATTSSTTPSTVPTTPIRTIRRSSVSSVSSMEPDYVTFGTYRGSCRLIEFTGDGLTLRSNRIESLEIVHKDLISIKWYEMKAILYCLDPILPVIFVMPLYEAYSEIKDWIDMGQQYNNGESFLLCARGIDHRNCYVKIVLKTSIGIDIVNTLKRFKDLNNSLECRPISLDGARKLLFRYHTRTKH